jgi:hypothetical protein
MPVHHHQVHQQQMQSLYGFLPAPFGFPRATHGAPAPPTVQFAAAAPAAPFGGAPAGSFSNFAFASTTSSHRAGSRYTENTESMASGRQEMALADAVARLEGIETVPAAFANSTDVTVSYNKTKGKALAELVESMHECDPLRFLCDMVAVTSVTALVDAAVDAALFHAALAGGAAAA